MMEKRWVKNILREAIIEAILCVVMLVGLTILINACIMEKFSSSLLLFVVGGAIYFEGLSLFVKYITRNKEE
jgi:hypothetical protein